MPLCGVAFFNYMSQFVPLYDKIVKEFI
ncbi:thymidine kinase, partial [Salmonella enterica subsp. enterica serovar Newport]|nr:thymidine kinase [Salmonella enterica subsp. enterica serovar Newport]